jgi:SAM-dependent methyltransferase
MALLAAPLACRPPKLDVLYFPTPHDVVARMLEMAELTPGDVLYDLGCGDGRIVIAAAKRYGSRAAGYDADPKRVRESLENARAAGVAHLVRIELRDIFTLDLSGATVVTLYLLPALNDRLLPQLRALKPGARIVSHNYALTGVKPDAAVSFYSTEDRRDHTLYLWKTPFSRSESSPRGSVIGYWPRGHISRIFFARRWLGTDAVRVRSPWKRLASLSPNPGFFEVARTAFHFPKNVFAREKRFASRALATSQLMTPGVARPPVTPAAPKSTFFMASWVPAAMCMKPMIMVGPPQAIPSICHPSVMMLSDASRLARLLTRTVPAVFTFMSSGFLLFGIREEMSLACGPMVPFVAPCSIGAVALASALPCARSWANRCAA